MIEGGTTMDPIYVTGHRNPDTDSIVAAMSFACAGEEREFAVTNILWL